MLRSAAPCQADRGPRSIRTISTHSWPWCPQLALCVPVRLPQGQDNRDLLLGAGRQDSKDSSSSGTSEATISGDRVTRPWGTEMGPLQAVVVTCPSESRLSLRAFTELIGPKHQPEARRAAPSQLPVATW